MANRSQFSENYFRGVQQAEQEFENKRKRENDEQDRKHRQILLKHEIDKLKMESELKARELDIQNLNLAQGRPAQKATFPAQGESPVGALPGMTQPLIPEHQAALPASPMSIRGVPSLGVAGTEQTPQTMEELFAIRNQEELQKQRAALQAKQLEPFTLGEGGMRVTPSETGPPTVFENPKPAPVTPRQTEGEIGRGLAAAYYRNKHKLPELPLTERQQAEADAEYDAYKKSLSRDNTAADLRGIIAENMDFQRTFQREATLRDDYSKRVTPSLQPKIEAYKTIEAIRPELEANKDSNLGGSDILLVYNYIKMNDPNAVRGEELTLAQQTQTLPQEWLAKAKRYSGISGNILGPEGRKSLLDAVDKQAQRFLGPEVDEVNANFRRMAESGKVNPDNLGFITVPRRPGAQQATGPKVGDTRSYQGATYKFDGKQWVKQ